MQDEALRRRDLILDAVGSIAERFLGSTDWRKVMDGTLRALGEATGASRVHLYENGTNADGELTSNLRFEFAAPGIQPQIANPAEIGFPLLTGGYGRWIDILGAGGLIAGTAQEFPESEQGFLAEEGILSVLVVPLFVEDRWWGWIGFDDCETEREWSPAETDSLRAVAGIIGAAMQRARTERRSHEAEAKYQALVEQIPAVVYISSADGENSTLYISPQIKTLLGYAQADWITKQGFWESLIHPDDLGRVLEEVARTEASGEPTILDYRMKSRYGKEVWIHEEATLIVDEDGAPKFWQGLMLDVTSQKEFSDRLNSAEMRYRAVVEEVPVMIYTEDLREEAQVTFMSQRAEEILGFPVEEWTNGSDIWLRQIHPDDRQRVIDADNRARENDSFQVEYRIFAADGRELWFYDEARLISDGEGEPVCWQGFMVDITDRKLAEAAVREAEDRYRSLVERTPAITYIEDATGDGPGRLQYVSPQLEKILGYKAEDWLEQPTMWRDLVHPDDLEQMHDVYLEAAASGGAASMDYRTKAADGRWVWLRDESVLVYDLDGKPQFWQGVMHDITQRKRAEDLEAELHVERETAQRLRDVDDMKNTFLTAVSHDLRTPLAAILGLAITLERDDLALVQPDGKDLTRRIASNARKLDRLVTDLLDLDRLTRGILEPKRHPTDVGALVRKVVDEADFLGEHPVQVEADPVVLSVDGAKVERIVENLLANTVRHTPPDTQVWVKVYAEGEGVVIAVEDAGPGVLTELRDSVFEPFAQGRGGDAASPSPGVGIGLSLVARFAELHEGRAWVDEREGGGASFKVFLPPGGETTFR